MHLNKNITCIHTCALHSLCRFRMMKDRIARALAKRKLVSDPFRAQNGYSWDYVIVFNIAPVFKYDADKLNKITEDDKKFSLKGILNLLSGAGLQTKLFYSCQRDEVYCKIRAPLKRLLIEADRIDYKLLLEPNMVGAMLSEGNLTGPEEKQWSPVTIPHNHEDTDIPPHEYIYAEYDKEHYRVASMYKKWSNNTVLRGVDRLKLISGIFSARVNDGGCHIDVQRLALNKNILGCFPLHDLVELRTLEDKWLRFCQLPWQMDVDPAKDYFGEKVGLYFVWLGHYTTWLISAAVMGFIAWIVVAADNNNPNTSFMPYFSVFIAIWSSFYIESWKRKEKTTAMKWGMWGFEDSQQVRAEFTGTEIMSPVDGSSYLYFPRSKYLMRLSYSISIIIIFIAIVIGTVGSIFYIRIILTSDKSFTINGTLQLGGIIASLLNAIQIQTLNYIYGSVAIQLTDYENHRTNTEYEDSLIAKTFAFQFVNSFAALFYIAFVKPFIPDLDPCLDNCLKELQTTLGTIFITRLATGTLSAILGPYIGRKLAEGREFKGVVSKEDISEVEVAFMSPEYHVLLGTFSDYAEMMIQFGYTTMFISAFPLAAVLSFVSNYIKIRTDQWKLCQLYRRPEPRSCEDIGSWLHILNIISILAVFINSALIAFTADVSINYSWWVRIWVFIGISLGIGIVKFMVAAAIPDVPYDVSIQIQRLKYIVGKVLLDIRDDDDNAIEIIKKDITNEYVIRYGTHLSRSYIYNFNPTY